MGLWKTGHISSGRMIQIITKEFKEGNLAVRETQISLFKAITLFKCRHTTTNNQAVKVLTTIKEPIKVTGFKNETKRKSKKN